MSVQPPDERDIQVLLADDDEAWLRSTAELLERQRDRLRVVTATTLAEAIARVDTADRRIDCIVSDYMFERTTGLELLQETRDRGFDRPFILVTGQGDETVASDAIGQQVTDYIPKRSLGGRDDSLARRIETVVEQHRTEQALAVKQASQNTILNILRQESSRTDLAQRFCDHLTSEHEYACAWIRMSEADTLASQAVAGREEYLTAVEQLPPDERQAEPTRQAQETDDLITVAPIEPDEQPGWRRAASEQGFQAAVGVPIRSNESVVGSLGVYKPTPAVTQTEQELLVEYGESIGYALRSVEWRESLLTPGATTIQVGVADSSVPLVRLLRQLPPDAEIEVLTTVPQEAALLYVVEPRGTTAASLQDATRLSDISAVRTIQSEPLQCEIMIEGLQTPSTVLVDRGFQIVDTVARNGRVSLTIVGGPNDDVSAAVDELKQTYDGVTVDGVTSGYDDHTGSRVGDIRAELTEKQRRALKLAYHEGYFNRPRDHNLTEIAEKSGVSRQTFAQHLRVGERKLLDALL